MSELKKVTGKECLNWISKPIGFANKERAGGVDTYLSMINIEDPEFRNWYGPIINNAPSSWGNNGKWWSWSDAVALTRFPHDTNKRIVGFVRQKYDDGGYYVVILGNEKLDNLKTYKHKLYMQGGVGYSLEGLPPNEKYKQDNFSGEVTYGSEGIANVSGRSQCYLMLGNNAELVPFYDSVDYTVDFDGYQYDQYGLISCLDVSHMTDSIITNDPTTTLIFGEGRAQLSPPIYFDKDSMNDPLKYLQGNLYDLACDKARDIHAIIPTQFNDGTSLYNYSMQLGELILTTNLVAIPYNIILTGNLQSAYNYLDNGVLPDDAFLFPLDWDNFPSFEKNETPDDDVDDGDDSDNGPIFDGDPDLPDAPYMTPNKASNNNYYWLTPYELEGFINWFWNDVGNIQDFDDIINKVMGLYNDLGSTILNIRYMPVDINWIGGLGQKSNIITGMIEKNGLVNTIAKANPPIIDIGHVKVPKDFKSFASYSPYASCSLYLPYHGFLDIDMDMFTGHDLYVKGIYDHLSGTLQYLIYYENKYLIYSIICKMAVDIPITLQSKNDRDSAIFQNVSNTVAGLMSAGTTLATGNPIGLVVGVNALTSGVHSAPLQVKGTVGETGAFYAPSKCKLIVRFPVEQKPSKFSQICGKQLNKTMKLNNSQLAGFTKCYNPRITFNNSAPMQSEIDEIYDYLEKGVIL